MLLIPQQPNAVAPMAKILVSYLQLACITGHLLPMSHFQHSSPCLSSSLLPQKSSFPQM